MTTVTFDLPDELAEALGKSPEAAGAEVRLAAALYWCSRGEMSTSKAARLAGLTYAEFLEEAARRNVDLHHYDSDEIRRELSRPLPEGVDLEAVKKDVARARSRRG
jgi:predicted HTH domain antitoxin